MDKFIEIPNLPSNKVSLAIVDGRISKEIEDSLNALDINIIKTEKIMGLYDSVSYHPDMMLHHLGNNKIIVAPNINKKLISKLKSNGFDIILGKREVGVKYPYDIAYNAARVGDSLICNIKYTDEVILENAKKIGLNIINIKQGYSKCSICIVDRKAIITSDLGIYRILTSNQIECCLIDFGGIQLSNMNYGFIGGASGYISKTELSFFGELSNHPNSEKIYSFLIKYSKKTLNLSKNIIYDYGTLIPLKEYSILTK